MSGMWYAFHEKANYRLLLILTWQRDEPSAIRWRIDAAPSIAARSALSAFIVRHLGLRLVINRRSDTDRNKLAASSPDLILCNIGEPSREARGAAICASAPDATTPATR